MSHLKKTLCRAGAFLCTAAAALAGTGGISAFAAEQKLVGYRGDIDGSDTVDLVDAAYLTLHLDTYFDLDAFENADRADMNGDGVVNAVDLTLIKRVILSGETPEGIYEEVEEPDEPETPETPDDPQPSSDLITPPIASLSPQLGSIGEKNILLIAVEFQDKKFERSFTTDDIAALAFGDADENSSHYPLESITAYYDRASYGRLHLTGDVYQYTTKNPIASYQVDSNGNGQMDEWDQNESFTLMVDEVLDALNDQIDYSKYDNDGNGEIDTILFALPATDYDGNQSGISSDYWWPCSGGYGGRKKFDRCSPGNLCIGGWALSDATGFNSTWIHELGHAMGLPDYYRYENIPAGEDSQGLNGDAGVEMMDEALGDMSAFSKLMYGWYAENEVQIYTGGTQTFTLKSSQHAPSCLVVPRSDLNGYLSEYFVIESVTPDGNFTRGFYDNYAYSLFRSGGVRILHCEASVTSSYWYKSFKYDNFSEYYDTSNLKQRVLRLVNNGKGFFKSGSTVNSSVSGFAWYDSSGYETVSPGITVTVDSIDSDGTATVTISQQ